MRLDLFIVRNRSVLLFSELIKSIGKLHPISIEIEISCNTIISKTRVCSTSIFCSGKKCTHFLRRCTRSCYLRYFVSSALRDLASTSRSDITSSLRHDECMIRTRLWKQIPLRRKRGRANQERFKNSQYNWLQNITFLLKYICKPLRKTILSEGYGCRQVDRDIPGGRIVIARRGKSNYGVGGYIKERGRRARLSCSRLGLLSSRILYVRL